MPKNRQHIPLEERRASLLEAATDVFRTKGYSATTMDDISTSAGFARANVYWYYRSKDDIFAAVMNQMLEDEISALTVKHANADPANRLLAGLVEMYPYRSLHREMHERMPYSDAVAAAHDSLIKWVRDLVYEVVADSDAEADRDVVADLILSIFEGSNTGSVGRPAHEMIPLALNSILPAAAGSRHRRAWVAGPSEKSARETG